MNTDKDVVDNPVGVVTAVVLGQAYGDALGYNSLGGYSLRSYVAAMRSPVICLADPLVSRSPEGTIRVPRCGVASRSRGLPGRECRCDERIGPG
jgi:hypothetical protein